MSKMKQIRIRNTEKNEQKITREYKKNKCTEEKTENGVSEYP